MDTFVKLPNIADKIGVTINELSTLSVREFAEKVQTQGIDPEEQAPLIAEFKAYPMESEAEQMGKGLVENGVPEGSIFEEDDLMDTISNILFVRDRLERTSARNVAIVANRDHLPRLVWLANYLLPKGTDVTFIETSPRLETSDFLDSCERERKSFLAGKNWMEPTGGDPEKVMELIYNGYFNPKTRRSAKKVAENVKNH